MLWVTIISSNSDIDVFYKLEKTDKQEKFIVSNIIICFFIEINPNLAILSTSIGLLLNFFNKISFREAITM